jgi:AraC-like DNA-binding protein
MSHCNFLYFTCFQDRPISQSIIRTGLNYELIYVKRGSKISTIYFDGGMHNIDSNDIIVIPPNAKYRFDCDADFECYCIGYSSHITSLQKTPYIFQDTDDKTVLKQLEMIKAELEGQSFKRKIMINLLLSMVLITILRFIQPLDEKKTTEEENFTYIVNLMDSQSQNGIDINEVSKMSGLSYHRFRHKFKEYTEISPQQYIIKQRIAFAKRLLQTTNYSTSLIATASGFHSVPQFITCFSKQENLTPVKYRKKFQNNVCNSTVKKRVKVFAD